MTADSTSTEATAQTGTSGTGMEGSMGGQRPDGGGQQNTDILPPDDAQKQPA